MAQKFTIEKFVMEDSDVYNIMVNESEHCSSVIVPKKDIAGFLYFALPDVRKIKLDKYPNGEAIAMALKLAKEHGKNYINFSNPDEELKSTIADLVDQGILKENWDNYEIMSSLPAPIVESFSVKIFH